MKPLLADILAEKELHLPKIVADLTLALLQTLITEENVTMTKRENKEDQKAVILEIVVTKDARQTRQIAPENVTETIGVEEAYQINAKDAVTDLDPTKNQQNSKFHIIFYNVLIQKSVTLPTLLLMSELSLILFKLFGSPPIPPIYQSIIFYMIEAASS